MSIQVMRTDKDVTKITSTLQDGQPLYHKTKNHLYIGRSDTQIKDLKYINQELEAKINENIIKDPNKTYLVWKGSLFPNNTGAESKFQNATIDWGDGSSEVGGTASLTHTYTDGVEYHIINIGNSTSILDYSFQGCEDLISIKFSQTLLSIGQSAFYNCTGLTEVIIPDSVTQIKQNAFRGCNNLQTIILGKGLGTTLTSEENYNIESGAFYGCSPSAEVHLKSVVPPKGSGSEFTNGMKFIVPKAGYLAYKPGWENEVHEVVWETDSSDFKNALLLDPSALGKQVENVLGGLNTYIEPGNYYCSSNAAAKDIGFAPSEIKSGDGVAFRLVVASANGEGLTSGESSHYPYLSQTLTSFYTGATWYRLGSYDSESTKEKEWEKYNWLPWSLCYADQIRTAYQSDDNAWGTSARNQDKAYSRLRVVEELPGELGTNIIYFVTES